MPSPFTWDVNKPGGTDPLNAGDDQIRADKATLRDVLRTLVPFGTPSVGWRDVQIGNDNWLTNNAYYDGTNWNRDDTSVVSWAIKYDVVDNALIVYRAPAAANPITWQEVARFIASGSGVQLLADPVGVLEAATKRYVDSKPNLPFLLAANANMPPTGGAILNVYNTTNEVWYALIYPDTSTAVADFEIPARKFGKARIIWRTPATTGNVKWWLEVREKGDGDSLGGGAVVASATVVAAAKATANQLTDTLVVMTYNPGPNKRIAILRVYRVPTDASDTLNNEAQLISVELLE